jgi:hypothetical protein
LPSITTNTANSDVDRLAYRRLDVGRETIPYWGGRRVFVESNGLVEVEEDCAEVGF